MRFSTTRAVVRTMSSRAVFHSYQATLGVTLCTLECPYFHMADSGSSHLPTIVALAYTSASGDDYVAATRLHWSHANSHNSTI
jgi:hypothetical protein